MKVSLCHSIYKMMLWNLQGIMLKKYIVLLFKNTIYGTLMCTEHFPSDFLALSY